jgi:hypothetical protein
MAELVHDCPRCGTKRITFSVTGSHRIPPEILPTPTYELFCICRQCRVSVVFTVEPHQATLAQFVNQGVHNHAGNLSGLVNITGHLSLKDMGAVAPPEHLPQNILNAFTEGARCFAVGSPNASATMFRLCVDLATENLVPNTDEGGLNSKTRRDLGLRLPWLFDNGKLPESLRELSQCIKDDGNDGAHRGTLTMADGEDLLDFAMALLDRLITEPKRLELAKERREKRRAPPAT